MEEGGHLLLTGPLCKYVPTLFLGGLRTSQAGCDMTEEEEAPSLSAQEEMLCLGFPLAHVFAEVTSASTLQNSNVMKEDLNSMKHLETR